MHPIRQFFGGIGFDRQRRFVGRTIVYQTNRNRQWQIGVVPPLGQDDINGDYIQDFPVFIVLPIVD